MINLGGLFLTKRVKFFIRSYNYWNFPNIYCMYMYVGTQKRILQRFAFVYEKGVHGFQSTKQGALPPRAENFGLTHTNKYPQTPKNKKYLVLKNHLQYSLKRPLNSTMFESYNLKNKLRTCCSLI